MLVRPAAMAAAIVLLTGSGPAAAEVLVRIDKSMQQMTVTVDGEQRHVWPISTGRAGFGTPNGKFRPQWMARSWFSRKYYNSPMPHSIFFHKGYAIHGTNYIRRLGGPASHGCVRLHPANAATLFALVKRHGMAATRISVTGANPVAVARRPRPLVERARAAVEPRRYPPAPAYRSPYPGYYYQPRPYYYYSPYEEY